MSTSHFLCGLLERYAAPSVFLYFFSINLFVSFATFSPPGFSVPFINLQEFGLYHNIPSDRHTRTRWLLLFICHTATLSRSPCIVSLPAACFSFSVMLVILRSWFKSHSHIPKLLRITSFPQAEIPFDLRRRI